MSRKRYRAKQTKNFMEKKSGFLDLGFVKTCDELVIDPEIFDGKINL